MISTRARCSALFHTQKAWHKIYEAHICSCITTVYLSYELEDFLAEDILLPATSDGNYHIKI